MNKIHTVSTFPVSYTFTGASRDATFSVSADTPVDMQVVSRSTGDATVKFSPAAPPRFSRARLLSSGAPLLAPPLEGIAADLVLVISGDSTDFSVTRKLSFVKWNEWEDKLISFGNLPDGDTYNLSIGKDSTCRLDDFNISATFVGEDFCPIIELEWDNGAFYVSDDDGTIRV